MLPRRLLVAVAAPLGLVAAQVTTKCNPLERSDCPADPGFGTAQLWTFDRQPPRELWETTAGHVDFSPEHGAAFTIAKQGDSPTLRTAFYFFFGRTEIWLRAAPGRGIISSMMWLSDDLDEVDWEFLGSNTTHATTNYFGKGRQDFQRGEAHAMAGMHDDYHNYTTVWTREQIDWYIDGARVRTLRAAEANRTENYPQTPMRMSIGIWAGGDPSLPQGTREWAGGDTDYAGGPYTMYLKKAHVTDYSTGSEYKYGDRSGSWQSIKVEGGNSTAADFLNKAPETSMREKWQGLSPTSKIAIGTAVAAAALLAAGGLLFYFLRQRRIGAREARLAEQRAETDRVEMEQFENKGFDPDGYSALAGGRGLQHGHDGGDDHDDEDDGRGPSRGGASVTAADPYHVPETSAASPLAASPWSGSVASSAPLPASASAASMASASTVAAAATTSWSSPRVGSPTPSSHYRDSGNALGFIPPLSPDSFSQQSSRAPSPVPPPGRVRASTPLSRSQSPGLPPPGPLPSPRSHMRVAPASRMGSPVPAMHSPPGRSTPGSATPGGGVSDGSPGPRRRP